jgi:hypothetical protein
MMPEPQMPVSLREAALIRPELAADHPEPRFQGLGVDAHPLDGARRGALTAGYLGALEGRAGWRGAGEQPFLAAEHDLGIGADVDHQHDLLGEVWAFRQDHPGGVGADVAGDTG